MRALPLLFVAVACSSKEPAAVVTDAAVDSASDTTTPVVVDTAVADTGAAEVSFPDPFVGCTKDPGPGMVTPPMSETGDDPTGGASMFTLSMALAGFTSTGTLKAAITTQKGIIVCTLDEAKAPITVANFVGLARGTRPFLASGMWQVKRFYDGLKWHRVIPGFVIQGGDPRGNGTGGPGYSLPKENQIPEPPGTLAMAASTEVSGSQFYITVDSTPLKDYNVFGLCELPVAEEISLVETKTGDVPVVPIHMQRIDIARCP
jgi:peptidyl-prolyl cis-trans isomerase A (cyclophilin A)